MAEEKKSLFPLLILPVIWGTYYVASQKLVGFTSSFTSGLSIRFVVMLALIVIMARKRRAWTVMENRRGKTKTDIDRNSWLSAGLDSILRFIHVLSSYRNSTSEVRRSYGEHHIGNRLQTEIYMESMGLHLCDAVRSIHGNGN